jgi:hypothetical protein
LPRVNSDCEIEQASLATFSDSFFWNNNRGAETVLSGLIHFDNFTAVSNTKAGLSAMEAYILEWPGLTFKNSVIIARVCTRNIIFKLKQL